MHTRVTPYSTRTQEEAEGRGSGCGCALTHSDSLLYAVSPIAQRLLTTQTVFLGGEGGREGEGVPAAMSMEAGGVWLPMSDYPPPYMEPSWA